MNKISRALAMELVEETRTLLLDQAFGYTVAILETGDSIDICKEWKVLGVITLSFVESDKGVLVTGRDHVTDIGSNVVKMDQGLTSVQNGLKNCMCIVAFVDQGESPGASGC